MKDHRIIRPAALTRDGVYFATDDGMLFAFDRKTGKFFDKNQFIKLYDRLGKYLHADNPQGNNKEWEDFALVVRDGISSIRDLFKLYFTVIRTPEFTGVWVLETRENVVQFLVAESHGEFIVENY